MFEQSYLFSNLLSSCAQNFQSQSALTPLTGLLLDQNARALRKMLLQATALKKKSNRLKLTASSYKV